MGDNFLRRQIGNFSKRRDVARADMNKPVMFERPEQMTTIFTAKPLLEERYESGECLLVLPEATSEERVVLVRGHRKVGYLDGDGAKALRDVLSVPESPGVAQVRIVDVSGLSGVAKAQIVQP